MPQTPTIEERVSHMEKDLAELKSQVSRLRPKENGIEPLTRSANGDPVELNSPQRTNPWLAGAGMFHGDPLFDDWQKAIAEYRGTAELAIDAP